MNVESNDKMWIESQVCDPNCKLVNWIVNQIELYNLCQYPALISEDCACVQQAGGDAARPDAVTW